MNKKYAIFDMDGTLIDSMKYWDNLAEEYLRSKGVKGDLSETLREFESITVRGAAKLMVKRFELGITPNEAQAEMYSVIENHYRNDIPLKAKVKDLLFSLKSDGVRMCVASATASPLIKACLDRLGVLDMFDFVLSCEDYNTDKRSSDIYEAAAKRFGAPNESVAVYEDARHAVKTAKAAGFYVVAVYDESSKKKWDKISSIADENINLD